MASHDISVAITPNGGAKTTHLLDIFRTQEGPLYTVSEEPLVLNSVSSGPLTDRDLPPEKKLTFSQDSWLGGHGYGKFRINDGYAEGQSIDTTQPGRIILGPLINTTTQLAASWSSPTGSEEANWTTDEDAYEDDDGTSWATSTATVAQNNWSEYLILTIGSTVCSHVRVMMHATYTAATWSAVDIDVYAGAWYHVWEGPFTGSDAWDTYALHVILTCTKIRIRGYNSAAGAASFTISEVDFGARGSSGTSLGEPPVAFEYAPAAGATATPGQLYMATTTTVWKWDATSVGWMSCAVFSGKVITDLKIFGTAMFVALGADDKYYYSPASTCSTLTTQTRYGVGFVLSTLTDGYANKFLVAPDGSDQSTHVLWKSKNPNEVSSNASGEEGGTQWATAIAVGDTSGNIGNLFLLNDDFLTGRSDNLYYLDTVGASHPLLDDLISKRDTNNFKYVAKWQGGVYFSVGSRIGELTARNAYDVMGPLQNIEDVSKVGTCVGLAADDYYLYAAMDEGTNTHIYKGREVRDDRGNLRWEWCPWVFLSTNACATMRCVKIATASPTLWFGYGNAAAYVTLSDNPTADSNARFCAQGFLVTPTFDADHPYWSKVAMSCVTEARGLAAADTITVYYQKDTNIGTSTWNVAPTPMFSALVAAGNGTIRTHLTSTISYQRIRFKIQLDQTGGTTSPELLLFQVIGVVKPEMLRIHDCTFSIGQTMTKGAKQLYDFLKDGRESTTLIEWTDLRITETATYCVMLPGSPVVREILAEKNAMPQYGIRVLLQEVDFA